MASWGSGGSSYGSGSWGGPGKGNDGRQYGADGKKIPASEVFFKDNVESPALGKKEYTCMRVDNREATTGVLGRIMDPWQGECIQAIEQNRAANNTRNGSGHNHWQPTRGLHVVAHVIATMMDYQMVMDFSVDTETSAFPGEFTQQIKEALSTEAFQPLDFPDMDENGPAHLDMKVKYKGHILLHVEGTGYSGDTSLHLTRLKAAEHNLSQLVPGSIVTQGIEVHIIVLKQAHCMAHAFNLDGHLISLGAQGAVIRGNMPRIHFELRRVERNHLQAMGNNADTCSIVVRDIAAQIYVRMERTISPLHWLRFSNALASAAQELAAHARRLGMRVEGPDQLLNWAQLYAIHQGWIEKAGHPVTEVANRVQAAYFLSMHDQSRNLHLVVVRGEVRLQKAVVDAMALATTKPTGEMMPLQGTLRPGGDVVQAQQASIHVDPWSNWL